MKNWSVQGRAGNRDQQKMKLEAEWELNYDGSQKTRTLLFLP